MLAGMSLAKISLAISFEMSYRPARLMNAEIGRDANKLKLRCRFRECQISVRSVIMGASEDCDSAPTSAESYAASIHQRFP